MGKIKFFLIKFKKKWDEYPFFASIFVFAAIFIFFGIIYFNNPGISEMDDHFFHFKYSYLLRTEGLKAINNFKWIYFSEYIQENNRYPVSLFQVLSIPFTYVKDMILGLKINGVFWASLTVALIYYIFRKSKIKYALVFILILLSSQHFFKRIIMGRPFVLTMALVILEIYLASNKKYRMLFVVSLFHVLWHQSTFFLPIIITIMAERARYIESKMVFLKNIINVTVAVVIGMAFYPGFPKNLWAWIRDLISINYASNYAGLRGEGSELYTVDPLNVFFGATDVFFLIVVVSTAFVIYYYISSKSTAVNKKISEKSEYSVLIYTSFIFLLISILGASSVSGRFFDFYFPIAVYLGGLIFARIIKDKNIFLHHAIRNYLVFAVVIFYIFAVGNNFINKEVDISKKDYRPIEKISEWIENKSSEKEIIFLNNWSWFATSFFYNNKNFYAMGIEPKILSNYDKKLYWKWYNIFHYNYYCEKEEDCQNEAQEVSKKLADLKDNEKNIFAKENGRKIINSIKEDFNSRFLVSDSAILSATIELNNDQIDEKFESKSEYNGLILKAYKFK